ncbi:Sec14p-like phosphatidylinositol transfer family protein [Striga asiatica]|uniref:Sec14p-like phosphatidylinositol transfer family protein n=1 Tax=Striga asiatica TaxID=4170 RepID=A0A5A7PXF9_STRAF|nr:Sec14p-like phosphatidylinositol transfer family protein [Striga asiatica]
MAVDGKEDNAKETQPQANDQSAAAANEETKNLSINETKTTDENKNENEGKNQTANKKDETNEKPHVKEIIETYETLSSPIASKNERSSDDDDGEITPPIPNLTDSEKKALIDLRSKLEHNILSNATSSSENDGNAPEPGHNVSLWGVPLLPSAKDERTNTLLLKFLRAQEFKTDEALEMLKKTLIWRKANKIDSIMGEDLMVDELFGSVAFVKGKDRESHPICYNVYGIFADEKIYEKTFGDEGCREKFLRWRMQLMEKEVSRLDFLPGGISTVLQVNDLKNAPWPSRKDLRHATKRALGIFQDNYPEFVAKNIFINVPFWYYAFNALLSPFLMQRTKSKFVFSRPSRVTDTLLKYIAAEEIPISYGGLRMENDPDFSTQDSAHEVVIKAGATGTVEIPAPEVGNTLIWDLTITGWDVHYKEEFVPTDESSYTVIVKKGRKISWQDEPIRNTFKNKEPGKIVITIENGIFKKKRILYRYKAKNEELISSSD